MATNPRAETGIVVNEIDAQTPGADRAEFVELFGPANAALDDQSLVLFNGNGDRAYRVIDLDGQSLNADGYFLAGNPGVAGVDVTFPDGTLQNGPDAVALYDGDFPAGGSPMTQGLIDAIVYGTNDADDTELLAALGQTIQYDEDANGGDDNESLARVPDGAGDFQATTPTPDAANGAVSPPPPAGTVLVSEVQGDGDVSPFTGQSVTIEAVVTADFRTTPNDPADTLGGIFVQEQSADEDGDPTTSEGLFVFLGNDSTADVAVGDVVRVDGTVIEFFDKTELTDVTSIEIVEGANNAITPATIALPLDQPFFAAAGNPLEAYEGMVATLPQELTVTQLFGLERFGTLHLSAANPYTDDGRLAQPTQVALPGADAGAVQDANDVNRILIDDGTNDQNVWIPDYLTPENPPVRGGDGVVGLTGILDYDFGEYRVRLDETVDFENHPRPGGPPDVGGDLKVASFNVLNYFTTIDDGANDARGADSEVEFALQEDKIVPALSELDADVVGLIELENNGFGPEGAIRSIVNALNAETGATYSFVNAGPGTIGTDAITVGMIYKPDVVRLAPGTEAAVLNDPSFTDPVEVGRQLNRPALAATFEEINTGAEFTLAVNHFKSKGSLSGDARDADQGDGQGNNNFTREAAAIKLAEWLATNPTGTEDEDRLIVGDLNSYAMEDPIRALEARGFTDLANDAFGGDDFTYGYRFSGQWGSLDYALANAELLTQVTGAADWHINADEPEALDYDDDVVDPGERPFEAKSEEAFDLVRPDAFRSSDHDPVLVGLDLAPEEPAEPSFIVLGSRERDATGTRGNDLILGNNKPNTIDGRGGDDLILGNNGKDKLFGGAGKDILLGGNGDDELDGGGGDDVIAGGKGRDVLDGGGGRDVYVGGKGSDVFVFADNSFEGGAEVVRDFENGRDKIDVSGLDFDAYAVFGNANSSVIDFNGATGGRPPAGETVERIVLLDVRPGQIDEGDLIGLPVA